MATQADFDYLAGLVDADGCISLTCTRGSNITPYIKVTNTYGPLPAWLENTFGGRSHINYCPSIPAGHKPQSVWWIGGAAAVALLRRIVDRLRIKRQQAWLAREFWAQRTLNQRGVKVSVEEQALRRGYLLGMRFLNRTGVS